jgi:hypothetical protein
MRITKRRLRRIIREALEQYTDEELWTAVEILEDFQSGNVAPDEPMPDMNSPVFIAAADYLDQTEEPYDEEFDQEEYNYRTDIRGY